MPFLGLLGLEPHEINSSCGYYSGIILPAKSRNKGPTDSFVWAFVDAFHFPCINNYEHWFSHICSDDKCTLKVIYAQPDCHSICREWTLLQWLIITMWTMNSWSSELRVQLMEGPLTLGQLRSLNLPIVKTIQAENHWPSTKGQYNMCGESELSIPLAQWPMLGFG